MNTKQILVLSPDTRFGRMVQSFPFTEAVETQHVDTFADAERVLNTTRFAGLIIDDVIAKAPFENASAMPTWVIVVTAEPDRYADRDVVVVDRTHDGWESKLAEVASR